VGTGSRTKSSRPEIQAGIEEMTGDCDSPGRRKIEIIRGIVNSTLRETKLGFFIEVHKIYNHL
jgi:hypothetical protein